MNNPNEVCIVHRRCYQISPDRIYVSVLPVKSSRSHRD
jgi:hypothetical protein